MDLFFIHGIKAELDQEIEGGSIGKIYQVNRTDLLFRIRRPGAETELLISTHPNFPRLHLTEKKILNPPTPPRFCTYLRKHILNARIVAVRQDPYERIVRLFLEKRLDAGAVRKMTLVAELVGKEGNVLLLEGERILDCLHFRKAEEGTLRPQVPGAPYVPPPPKGWPLSEVTPARMEEIFADTDPPWKALAGKISGLSALLAREIDFLSAKTPEGYWKVFQGFLERYEHLAFEPNIASLPTGKKTLAPFRMESLGCASAEIFRSLNEAADSYYFETVTARRTAEQKQSLVKRLNRLLSRLQKKREHLLSDRERFEEDLGLRDLGEMLVAHYGLIRKGMKEIEIADPRRDPPGSVIIPLDPALDAAGNVDRYFKKYKKAKRGLEFLAERIEQTDRETAYLESCRFQAEEAEDAEELAGIRKELEEEKILPISGREGERREKREVAVPFRRLRSSDGLEIFCGKNNMGNDHLLRHLAKGNDLWFHAQGVPGSHVVLRVGKGAPPFTSILEAATVAAFYSRGRSSTRLPVDYTAAGNVHRPRGARPGLVTYLHQKTVFVAPNRDQVQKLLIKER